MAWFVIILMSFSILGFVGGAFFYDSGSEDQGGQQIEYNGFTFTEKQGYWELEYGGLVFGFFELPSQLKIVDSVDVSSLMDRERVYLATNPAETLVDASQVQFLATVFAAKNVRAQSACSVEQGCGNIPVVDCSSEGGLIVQSGEVEGIRAEENCVVIEGRDLVELQRYIERVVYQMLGVLV